MLQSKIWKYNRHLNYTNEDFEVVKQYYSDCQNPIDLDKKDIKELVIGARMNLCGLDLELDKWRTEYRWKSGSVWREGYQCDRKNYPENLEQADLFLKEIENRFIDQSINWEFKEFNELCEAIKDDLKDKANYIKKDQPEAMLSLEETKNIFALHKTYREKKLIECNVPFISNQNNGQNSDQKPIETFKSRLTTYISTRKEQQTQGGIFDFFRNLSEFDADFIKTLAQKMINHLEGTSKVDFTDKEVEAALKDSELGKIISEFRNVLPQAFITAEIDYLDRIQRKEKSGYIFS